MERWHCNTSLPARNIPPIFTKHPQRSQPIHQSAWFNHHKTHQFGIVGNRSITLLPISQWYPTIQTIPIFFKAVKSHHARSKIVSITREDGSRIEDPNTIKEEAIKNFQRLLSENQPHSWLWPTWKGLTLKTR
jgi:hypothetical protein